MIKISATLYKVSYDELKEVLTCFFGLHNLKFKSRVIGEEFKYLDSKLEFFCYSSLDKKWKGDEENFIVDSYLKMDQEEVAGFVSSFSEALEKNGIIYDIEYLVQDKEGNYSNEEVSRRHPEYINFIKTHYQ